MSAQRRTAVGAALLLVTALTACTVGEPDPAAWNDRARQSLDDAASEVATARLTLTQLDEGRLPASYGVVLVADAEEAVATAEETLSTVQPPARLGPLADRVLTLIGKAVAAVQAARKAVVAGRYDVPGLVARLGRLVTALDRRRAAL